MSVVTPLLFRGVCRLCYASTCPFSDGGAAMSLSTTMRPSRCHHNSSATYKLQLTPSHSQNSASSALIKVLYTCSSVPLCLV